MAASVQFRPHNRDLDMAVREVDENLAIFLGMRNAERQVDGACVDEHSGEVHNSNGKVAMPDGLLASNTDQIGADDEILKLETDRSDFDWLLAADTSLLPSVEIGVQDSEATRTEFSNGKGTPLETEPPACDRSSVSNSSSEPAKQTRIDSTIKRPSSSGNRKPISRSATPTRRSSLPAKPKPSSSSAPSSRTSLPSSKPTAAKSRSSTPAKATPRSSTPSRTSVVPVSSTSKTRSATPTRKTAVAPSDQPAMVRKTGTSVLKVPLVKSRPSKPLESLSVSHDGTQSLKASVPKRPASASRGRPSGPTNLSSKNGKPRQKSCSPARVRAPTGTAHKPGNIILSKSRANGNSGGDDEVNPVLMGTQMVERVVNMRKLAPPKQDECLAQDNPKKSSKASGFGRSLSSRSLDMAVRHMDIRRSMVDGIRPVAIGVSSSSTFGIRSSSAKSGTTGASESPVASSSDGSEFSSGGYNSRFADENELDGSSNTKC